MSDMRFSIVLPCYNEAENIPILLQRFQAFSHRNDFELILVNNGSTDHSAEVFEAAQQDPTNYFLKVVTVEQNLGYGYGIHTGLLSATGEILAYSHADIQTPPEDLFKAVEMVEAGEVDLTTHIIKGFRINRGNDKTFLTRGLSWVVKMLLGTNLQDINGQPKVFDRRFFEGLRNSPSDFSYDLFILYNAQLMGLEIRTFDVDFGERIHGQSWAFNFFSRYKTILKYFQGVFRLAWLHRAEVGNPVGQLLRFLITGIFTNLLNFGTFWFLLHVLSLYYVVASVTGFLAGWVLGFFVNRSFTFRAKSGRATNQMSKFFIVNMVSLCANVATIYFMVDLVGLIPEAGQLIAIGVSTIINFSGSKFWAFSKVLKA